MKICAIISEYNPFHFGHEKHIRLAKQLSQATHIMAIMSGNFSQRGEPTIINKYERSRAAVSAGADVVVQLPTAYSCASAEVFALAGIKIANSFTHVTHLAFGCESTNVELLQEIAQILAKESDEYKKVLKQNLDAGQSYIKSREIAVSALIDNRSVEVQKIMRSPNNILAIEYLKAIIKTNSKIIPVFIHREHDNFNSVKIMKKHTSATAIRHTLHSTKNIKKIKPLIPTYSYKEIANYTHKYGLVDIKTFHTLLTYKLKIASAKHLQTIFDVSEGLENRIVTCAKSGQNFDEIINTIKTKRYTTTRLNRIALSNLLNINAKVITSLYNHKQLPFIKVLAIKKDDDLLKILSKNPRVILRTNNIPQKKSFLYTQLQNIENNANQVYAMLFGVTNKNLQNDDLAVKTIMI